MTAGLQSRSTGSFPPPERGGSPHGGSHRGPGAAPAQSGSRVGRRHAHAPPEAQGRALPVRATGMFTGLWSSGRNRRAGTSVMESPKRTMRGQSRCRPRAPASASAMAAAGRPPGSGERRPRRLLCGGKRGRCGRGGSSFLHGKNRPRVPAPPMFYPSPLFKRLIAGSEARPPAGGRGSGRVTDHTAAPRPELTSKNMHQFKNKQLICSNEILRDFCFVLKKAIMSFKRLHTQFANDIQFGEESSP